MPGKWPRNELPNLNDDNCRITSEDTRRYNCIAWAAGENFRNWWPDPFGIGYWPLGVVREETMQAFVAAYQTGGFTLCVGGLLEPGLEKIALFGKKSANSTHIPTHAALQLESGEWTSKLGPFEDITHLTLDAVNGPVYGEAIYYLSRPRRLSARI